MYPQEFLYTKEHEWIRVDEEIGTIGITDHAQKELGDIVYVELPKPGEHVAANESFGTVESVKAVSEIYSPVSGEVAAVNAKLQNNPEMLNSRSPRRSMAGSGAALGPQRDRKADDRG